MYQRKDGLWVDTLPRKGKSPKFFYGKTKAEVKSKMSRWKEDEENGVLVSDALDEWLESRMSNLRFHTIKQYRNSVNHLKSDLNGYMKDLSVKDVQAYFYRKYQQGYSRQSVDLDRAVISMCFDWLIVQDKLNFNPVKYAKIPKELKQSKRKIPEREYIEIIKHSVDESFGLFAYLLIYTGLRRNEALALTDSDFGDVISISKQVIWENGKAIISPTKTQAGNRTVLLLKPLKEALPKWTGYLFSEDGGESPLTKTQFYRLWNKYCKNVGLMKLNAGKWESLVTPHQLRHEFATICFNAGLDPADAKVLLGHEHESTTREIYTHILQSRKEQSNKKLEQFVESYY